MATTAERTAVPSAVATPSAIETLIVTVEFTDGFPRPDDLAAANWIQTGPEPGWFTILRFYSPLQPFFDRTRRAGEIELVT